MRFSFALERLQVSRFAVAGGISVLVFYLFLFTLTEFFGLWYVGSAFIAFIAYFAVNFSLQKYWVFKNRDLGSLNKQLQQFAVMAIVNWIVNTSLLYLLVEHVGMYYLLAQGILTIVVSVAAYFILRYIFRH